MLKPDVIIVDEEDSVVGQASFQKAVDDELIRRIVRIVLINSNNQVLVQQRSSQKVFPHLWDFAAAGHVDAGETYLQAAVREMSEEIGLNLDESAFVEFAHFPSTGEVMGSDGLPRVYRAWGKSFIAHGEGPFLLQEAEVQQIKWISQKELADWVANEPKLFMKAFHDSYSRFLEKFPKGYKQ